MTDVQNQELRAPRCSPSFVWNIRWGRVDVAVDHQQTQTRHDGDSRRTDTRCCSLSLV
jgi:hypothetical protein